MISLCHRAIYSIGYLNKEIDDSDSLNAHSFLTLTLNLQVDHSAIFKENSALHTSDFLLMVSLLHETSYHLSFMKPSLTPLGHNSLLPSVLP